LDKNWNFLKIQHYLSNQTTRWLVLVQNDRLLTYWDWNVNKSSNYETLAVKYSTLSLKDLISEDQMPHLSGPMTLDWPNSVSLRPKRKILKNFYLANWVKALELILSPCFQVGKLPPSKICIKLFTGGPLRWSIWSSDIKSFRLRVLYLLSSKQSTNETLAVNKWDISCQKLFQLSTVNCQQQSQHAMPV
jgi:hypothetical protein